MTAPWNVMYPATSDRPEELHVVPEQWSDEQTHVIEPGCWCQPVLHSQNVAGGQVWVHKRALRPTYGTQPIR